jgi:hypothetical protein
MYVQSLGSQGRRVFALLIANDQYDKPMLNLDIPVHDVDPLATFFDGRATVKVVKNAGGRELLDELEGFAAEVRAAATSGGLQPMVFVHYSGHGVEIGDDTVMLLRDFDGEEDKGLVSVHDSVGMFAPVASVLGTFDCSRPLICDHGGNFAIDARAVAGFRRFLVPVFVPNPNDIAPHVKLCNWLQTALNGVRDCSATFDWRDTRCFFATLEGQRQRVTVSVLLRCDCGVDGGAEAGLAAAPHDKHTAACNIETTVTSSIQPSLLFDSCVDAVEDLVRHVLRHHEMFGSVSDPALVGVAAGGGRLDMLEMRLDEMFRILADGLESVRHLADVMAALDRRVTDVTESMDAVIAAVRSLRPVVGGP